MADDVTITFTADVSDLQQGMQQATSAVEATTSALRSGAAQINSSFASLSQAYGSAAAKNIATVRTSSDTELAIARQSVQAQYDIASNGVKEQVSLVKEQAQTGQISRQQELSSLLALETQREDIERQYLQFVQNTYQQGTVAYAAAQRRIDELASQSALRRQEIERNVTQQIDADYKRSFDQIASSVSSSIMGMITSHQSLKQSAIKILDQILSMFIQSQVKMVANWLAGQLAQTMATTTSQTAQTAAVTAGVAARTGAEFSRLGSFLGGHHQQRASQHHGLGGRDVRGHLRISLARPWASGGWPRCCRRGIRACRRGRSRDGCLEPAERHDRPSPSRRNGHPCRGYPMGTGADIGGREHARREHGSRSPCDELQCCGYGFAGCQAILEKQLQTDHAHD